MKEGATRYKYIIVEDGVLTELPTLAEAKRYARLRRHNAKQINRRSVYERTISLPEQTIYRQRIDRGPAPMQLVGTLPAQGTYRTARPRNKRRLPGQAESE